MFDAKRLLDQVLGGQAPQGRRDARGDAHGRGGGQAQGGANPLESLTGNLGLGGIGGGALAGGLASVLLGSKKGRKFGGTALKVGGMAVVGGLAYKAWRDWQAGQKPQARGREPASAPEMLPPPGETPFNPADEAEQQLLGRHLLQAMVAAAKADGHIDAQEQANIFAGIDRLDLDGEDKAFLMDELRAPLDVDAIARLARTPEEGAEIYTASLMAIDVDNPAERGYLAMLAARLKLDDGLVEHLHASVEDAHEADPAPR